MKRRQVTHVDSKYNSQDENSFSILGCPMFARGWQTWDRPEATNLFLAETVPCLRPETWTGPTSRKRRAKWGTPKVLTLRLPWSTPDVGHPPLLLHKI